jgi:hypothetical protein
MAFHNDHKLFRMTLNKTTLVITTVILMAFGITTFGMMTLSINNTIRTDTQLIEILHDES